MQASTIFFFMIFLLDFPSVRDVQLHEPYLILAKALPERRILGLQEGFPDGSLQDLVEGLGQVRVLPDLP